MGDEPYYDDVARQPDGPLSGPEVRELRVMLETQRSNVRFWKYVRGRLTFAGLGIGAVLAALQLWDRILIWLRPP